MDEIVNFLELRDVEILLILDYDGTLADIVLNPMEAKLTEERKRILESLNSKERVNILINSGRPIEELVEITGNIKIDLLGNHGLFFKDWSSQEFTLIIDPGLLKKWDEQMLAMKEFLQKEILVKYKNLWLQENKHGFVLHTRKMDPANKNLFLFELESLLKNKFKDIDYSTGKEIIEVKPTHIVNKGKGIDWYIKNKFNPKTPDYRTIVVGDDITDEDMFIFVNKLENGMSIKVGSSEIDKHKRVTAAKVVFDSIEDFYLFLEELDKMT